MVDSRLAKRQISRPAIDEKIYEKKSHFFRIHAY
jgi:hypothetical protein